MTLPVHTPPAVFEDATRRLVEWCGISSASGDGAGLEKMADVLRGAFRERGLDASVLRRADRDGDLRPVVLAQSPGLSPNQDGLLVVGHFDTVLDAGPVDQRLGRLHGTGAVDMKGGLVAFVGALDVLQRRGGALPPDLRVVLVPDEEVAGPISVAAMVEWGHRARGLWVLEPGSADCGSPDGGSGSETVVGARRGSFDWRFDVAGRPAHAGTDFWSGRSALAAASDLALRVRTFAGPGHGPTVNPARLLAADGDLIEDLETASRIVGTPARLNVVPDRALLEGEARSLRRRELLDLEASLDEAGRNIAREHGVDVRFRVTGRVPPHEPVESSRSRIARACAHADSRGWTLTLEQDRAGLSFSNFLPEGVSLPTLDGLGPVGGGMHTRGEWVDLASLDRRIDLLAHLLADEAETPPAAARTRTSACGS